MRFIPAWRRREGLSTNLNLPVSKSKYAVTHDSARQLPFRPWLESSLCAKRYMLLMDRMVTISQHVQFELLEKNR